MKKVVKKKTTKKRIFLDILMALLLIFGIVALFYPFISDTLNTFLDQQIINYYQAKANAENEEAIQVIQKNMEQKNKELAEKGSNPGADPWLDATKKKKVPTDPPKDYYQSHTIGIVNIPKLKIKLPIFDTTNDLFLAKGTSLLEGTSYPTGGDSTHAVISGHRGLPEAKLFTDLPELKKGDQFFIEINKAIHAYEVDQIKVVDPTNTDYLYIEKGQDLVTLLTCTPYMINSHRLLVRGHRIVYVPAMAKELNKADHYQVLRIIGIVVGGIILIVLLVVAIVKHVKTLAIAKKRYLLEFSILQNQKPLTGVTFAVYDRRGKRQITRDGKPLEATSDEAGTIQIEAMKGGKYVLKSPSGNLKIRIKKVTDKRFTLLTQKSSWQKTDNYSIENNSSFK
ncbi:MULTISPECIES: class C sortase [Enterococcus]|uniref:class C sortase n=1 Tax=Enterococcus TaxID=1350 RepID=UPI00116544DE|nr:class C sortase [Enterococcus avium]HAP3021578.1 class C sortase [Enterococcus faecalis]AYQ24084.1 class C sortase [Enterococcus avium]HBI1562581.1 class C sortase [Enterococcus faecalis]HBI1565721.1 class C sortase [Enterococcus faecalis]HBI1717742.1 class C sortase [Enterococcus faecalis]